MKVLVIGNGGREHALSWKIAQSNRVERVFVAPGNAGTAEDAENVDIPTSRVDRLIQFAKENQVGVTVVGPEAPLAAGIVDAFQSERLRILGPTKNAAQLEASKVFCKHLLRQADVPTADYQVFLNEESASRFIRDRYPQEQGDVPLVIKADGLASGKGVVVCHNRNDALLAIRRFAVDQEFGDAGRKLVIEERLDGQEASIMAFTDGRCIIPLPSAQDHKSAYDGDKGPNTGGMGAYSPTPLIDDQLLSVVSERVLVPTLHAMKRSRNPFHGILYAGLILTNQGPKVLEFNVRLGDPECQPILMRLESDLMDLIEGTIDGTLDRIEPPRWNPNPAVCVVMASDGYPGPHETGKPIRGLEEAALLPDVKVFHGGTARLGGTTVTAGGRVLGVTAIGNSISAAKLQAYRAVKCIRWDGAWCRKDISDKALGK
jgi:phosphoribosylamine---glycine ligase